MDMQIFRAGTHVAMGGESITFSETDLQKTAAAYKPEIHEAPLVVGHPTHDAPAYGWVRKVLAVEGELNVTPYQVDPAFSELVNAGRFKKISASFYKPDSPSNPVPGVFYLRHVGFLGAQPPAIKGLRPVSFAEQQEGVICFGETDGYMNEQQLVKKEAELRQREEKIRKKELEIEFGEFLGTLVREGKVLPVQQNDLVQFLGCISSTDSSTEVVEFGESKATPLEFFKNFLKSLPKQVEYSEIAKGKILEQKSTNSFPAPPRFGVDSIRLEIHEKAIAYQESHGCDYVSAVMAVESRGENK